MDEFWAECYEMSKVLTHKRSREIGESKLKFQSKYQEPYTALRKIENTRYNNVLGQLLSHSSFIKRRWLMAKRQFFGPRGAWSDENTGKKKILRGQKLRKMSDLNKYADHRRLVYSNPHALCLLFWQF